MTPPGDYGVQACRELNDYGILYSNTITITFVP